MAKFKKGDRVVNLEDNRYVQKYAIGTVDEDDSTAPYVFWDKPQHNQDNHWPRDEDHLQLLSEWQERDFNPFKELSKRCDELVEENARLRAELEQLKPKPNTWEGWVYLCEVGKRVYGVPCLDVENYIPANYIARQRFTIIEGEGME